MSGTLFVVATPLGNIEDVTLRAIRVLREVDVIAAEDTRRTARLLAHHAIATKSISFHQHNVRVRVPQLLSRLRAGERVALVTDAGTPGVSDPGVELVAACIEAQIPIDPVPGPSAPLAAAVASGFPMTPLTIFGFPPRRAKDRMPWLAALVGIRHTVTLFESPNRIRQTLTDLSQISGNRQIVVGRELTKLHQQFLRGSAAAVLQQLNELRGEFTIVISPGISLDLANDHKEPDVTLADAARCFSQLTKTGMPRRAAISTAAKRYRVSARSVYAAVEAAKDSDE